MSLSPTARLVLRGGSFVLLVAAVVLIAVAALVPGGSSTRLTAVDPAAIALPDPGLFGGSATVYGTSSGSNRPGPRELDCTLFNGRGQPQGAARLSALRVVGDDDAVLDGQRLRPLFAVTSWSRGSSVACERGDEAAPMALGAPSTFGGNTTLVRAVAASGALAAAGVGVFGLFLTRRPRTALEATS